MNNLGFLYQNGQGVVQDYGTAMQWYLRAAEKGTGPSMNQIGFLYENGLGVPQNRTDALAWYRKAANLGVEDAKKNVARLEAGAEAPVVSRPAPPMKKARPSIATVPAGVPAPDGVVVGNVNGEPSLQFQVTYYCRNTLQFGQVSTCGNGNIIIDQQSVSFHGTGDCQMGDACGALTFVASKAKATLKFEGGREGDTVSIYFNGHRQRFGDLKAGTPFMLLLQKAFEDFAAAYASVR
jgi:TPR repeat protein